VFKKEQKSTANDVLKKSSKCDLDVPEYKKPIIVSGHQSGGWEK
jgi:hypothetical protein